MKEGFRQTMAWLHSWSGLLAGWVLFLVFCSGTAAYYRYEITFWMKPELHAASLAPVSQETALTHAVDYLQAHGAGAQRWVINLPDGREPLTRVFWVPAPRAGDARGAGRRPRFESAQLEPATGRAVTGARETRGGDFLYRLHYDLHYLPPIWARWIVGFCAMFMLVAIVSGIVTHKRIFKDFFTFRPKKGQRSWLDAHNATAVLALPYHLMITYTGLVTLMFLYMPWGPQAAFRGDEKAFDAALFPNGGRAAAKPSGQAAPLVPLAPLLAEARSRWDGQPASRIVVNLPGDQKSSVSITSAAGANLSTNQPAATFAGASGALTGTSGEARGPASGTHGVLFGLHMAHFAGPFLRALFFLCGLSGCAMVATGLLLWAVKMRQQQAKALAQGARATFGLRLVEGLNLAAIAGVPIAIASYFWANRLLPLGMEARAQAEANTFFIAWGIAAVFALARPTRRMWRWQLGAGAALFLGIPVVNALTTSSHLGVTLAAGLWQVAAVDIVCAALGVALGAAAWMLGRSRAKGRASGAPAPAAPPRKTAAREPGTPQPQTPVAPVAPALPGPLATARAGLGAQPLGAGQ